MSGSNNVDKQIQETKKTTEELKAQLKNLIDLRNTNKHKGGKENSSVPSTVRNEKCYDGTNPKCSKFDLEKNRNCVLNQNVFSPKKVRSYDVHEAREYIRKQREKRSQQLKSNEAKLKDEIKKEKLQRLHEKAQEIVLKNVHINRQRSKSREKDQYIRIDGCNQLRNKSVSKERDTLINYESKPTVQEKIKTKSVSNVGNNQEKNLLKSPNLNHMPSINYNENVIESRLLPQEAARCVERLNAEFQEVTENNERKNDIALCLSKKDDGEKIKVLSNITLKESKFSRLDNQISKNLNLDQLKETKLEPQQDIQSINSREVNTKKEYPVWLQEGPEEGHPLNFINTVKRKLQYAVLPNNMVDVGIQSSFSEINRYRFVEVPNTPGERSQTVIDEKNDIKDISRNKSFHSHQNLDIKSIKHLELISNSKHEKRDGVEYHNSLNENRNVEYDKTEESESDTSKNIPDISSESGTSLRKNAESVRRNLNTEFNLSIDTDKINQMKLVPQIKSKTTTIRSENQKIFVQIPVDNSNKMSNYKNDTIVSHSTENVYDFDFESDNYSSPCLSKSRESILSFNSPEYNEQKVIISLPQKNMQLSSINTVKSVSSPHYNIKIPVASSQNDKSPISTELILSTIKSQNSLHSSHKIPPSSSPKNQLSLKTECSLQKNIPDIIITKNSNLDSMDSIISSLNGHISSSSQKASSEPYSSQIETSYIHSNQQNINTRRGSGKSCDKIFTDEIPLEDSKVSLTNNNDDNSKINVRLKDNLKKNKLLKNVSVRSRNLNNESEKTNEIHLKFEAEIHLLNDFNQSLRQFSEVEKVVESLKSKKELPPPNVLQNKDTQTSGASKSSISTKSTTRISDSENQNSKSKKETPSEKNKRTRIGEKENRNSKSKSDVSSINFSRGSHLDETSLDNNIFENSILKFQSESGKSPLSTRLDISQMNSNKSLFGNGIENLPICEIPPLNNYVGFSLIMFDQLIKDEDARLEHLKMILKIREKALLDRVRAELASLEIQRKHYKETGNLQEVSAIKKKQRGILLNHQREKHEMQRVKQIQGAASVERKTILKEQRNLIRKGLSTDNMLGKMKVNIPRKRTSSGPLKVIQSHTESIMSETSLSRKSSTEREEVYSATSHQTISRISVSEMSEVDITMPKNFPTDMESVKRQQNIKRTLLMREAALRKRRKEAEELLQWNQKLLEEEKRINELELKASSIIRQQHNTITIPEEKKIFNGKQLNKLWYNVTGCEENKFPDHKVYRMSQIALERFCKSAREYSVKTKKIVSKSSNSDYSVADINVSENVPKLKTAQSSSVPSESEQHKDHLQDKSLNNVSVKDYTSDFEVDTSDNVVDVEDVDVNENIDELDELIHNLSRIENDISSLSSKHSRVSLPREELTSESPKSNKSESEAEISVIETNGTSKNIFAIPQNKELVEDEELIYNKDKSSNKTEVSIDTVYSNNENISLPTETQENLNKSKEILLILGESEHNLSQKSTEKDQRLFDEQTSVENINTSEEILSTLNQIVDLVSDDKIHEDSALINISAAEKEVPVIESVSIEREENLNISKNIFNLAPDELGGTDVLLHEHCTLVNSFGDLTVKEATVHEVSKDEQNEKNEPHYLQISENFTISENIYAIGNEKGSSIEDSCQETDIEEDLSVDLESIKNDDGTVETSLILTGIKATEIEHNDGQPTQDTTSTSKHIETEHSEQLVEAGDNENDITTNKSYIISDHWETAELSQDDSSAVHQDLHSGSQVDESSSRLKETVAQQISINPPSTIENETEQIQEKSDISKKSNSTIETENNEVQNESYSSDKSDSEKINEIPSISNTSQSSILNDSKSLQQDTSVPKGVNKCRETSPKSENIDVKKRVSEIMADANQILKGGDKSPRLQDFYTTTYDLTSPTNSPELKSPVDEQLKIAALSSIFDNEAEEILKKQLAIEQEIKQITEQQQKQQMPYMYMREIPNKPPPPYTPPSSLPSTITSVVVIPTVEEIDKITEYSAKILHKAYLSNNLENILISDKTLNLIAKDIPKEKYKFVFDLCKDLSKEHYKQFKTEKCPSWMQVCKKPQLIVKKPFGAKELEKYISKKLREVFGYEKPHRRENSIIKWSRKKRDHVDEILVVECQAEEDQWVNYEKDELLVINQITNDIMETLLKESADIFSKILSKPLE